MLMTRAKSFLSVALVSAAATLGGTAQAAFYTGTWDPAYGGPFPNLGWKATGLFDVPDACAAIGTGTGIPVSGGSCAGFDVLSARVDFYNVAAPGAILASFNLNPDVFVSGISLTNGKLSGDQISFTAGGNQYKGRVNGNVIEGNGSGGNWKATRAGS